MTSSRASWILGGLAAGLTGLATSHAVALVLGVRQSPVVAVAEAIVRILPGNVAERGIRALGHLDKPFLLGCIIAGVTATFAVAGLLARRHLWAGQLVFVVLGVVGGLAVVVPKDFTGSQLVPVLVGLATWLLALPWVSAVLRRPDRPVEAGAEEVGPSRRGFLVRVGALGLVSAGFLLAGRWLSHGRRAVEQARELLHLDGVTKPAVPRTARIGLRGVTPWMTESADFYQVHTAIAIPAIDPADWSLRIHGMVDRELVLSFQDLLDRRLTEAWITLNCVSNPVGGDLIGNAWWSGVRVKDLLVEAGVRDGADAVLQTSRDGWTCGTPLTALLDARDALLAVAMNGEPLPLEHGFPVRTIVPGLYGYVSACKWVVDLEVTRFDRISAYWTSRGWAEEAPVKISSRIDVPKDGARVAAGPLRVGGVAWAQFTGIEDVEVSLDGGAWQSAEVGYVPTNDTWVQWAVLVYVEPGDHQLRVRAVDKTRSVQTGVERDVLPDGATGWHSVDFTAEDA